MQTTCQAYLFLSGPCRKAFSADCQWLKAVLLQKFVSKST